MSKHLGTCGPASWNGWRMAGTQNPKDICLKILDRRGRTCLEWRFKSIFAHKKVLASGSPVFKAQFYPAGFADKSEVGKFKEGGCDVLEIKDTSVEAVELMIDFLYGKELKWAWECKSPESVYDICLLASKYAVQKLTNVAVKQLIRKDAKFASEFLDPEIISACAANMFSEVRSVEELQKLAGLISLSNNPADWRAFCFLLPHFKLELCLEKGDSNPDANNDLPTFINSKEIEPSPVITLDDSPTSHDLPSDSPQQNTVFPLTGNSFSFLRSGPKNENSDNSATPPGFLFSSPTPVRHLLSSEWSPTALFPQSFFFLNTPVSDDLSASSKSFKFSSPTDVFNRTPPVLAKVHDEVSVKKSTPVASHSSVPVPDIAKSLKTFFVEELDLDPGSPNLLDDRQLFSAECSPSRLPPSSGEAFSSIKSPLTVTNSSSTPQTDTGMIMRTPGRVNKDENVKRGTIRCKPFELLRKEVSLVEEEVLPTIGILPKYKDLDRQVEIVEIDGNDLSIRKERIHTVGKESLKRQYLQPVLRYPCSEGTCFNVMMSSLKNWRRHMKNVHKNLNADFNGTTVNVNKKPKVDVEIDPFDFDLDIPVEDNPSHIMFKCEMCDFTSDKPTSIILHKEKQHNWCALCYSSFKSQETMRFHMKYVHR